MKKKVNQLKIGVLLSYINLAIGCIIPMIYTPIMLRILGQSEYGLYSLSVSVTGYLSLLSFGMGSTMIRYIAKYRAQQEKEKEKEIIGLFLSFFIIVAILVIIISVIVAENAGVLFGGAIHEEDIAKLRILIYIMAFNTAVSFLTSVFSSAIIAHERFLFDRLTNVIVTASTPILNIIALVLGFGSIGMAICGLSLTLLFFPINIIYAAKRLKIKPRFVKPEKALLIEIIGFTFFVFLGTVVDMLFWTTDKVILGALVGTVAVAVYNVGSTFNTIITQLSQTISGVLTPRITSMVVLRNDKKELSDLFIKVARIQFIIVGLALSGFVAFGRPFLHLWAGPEYNEAYYVALLTMLPLFIPLTQNSALSIVIAQNKHRFRAVVYFVIAILNAVSTWLIVPYMGLVGAALCSCISYVLGQGLIMNIYYYKVTGLDIPRYWKQMMKLGIIPILMCSATLILNCWIDFYNPILFITGVVVYALLYCILMYLFMLNEYEKNTFAKPIKRIASKIKKEKTA